MLTLKRMRKRENQGMGRCRRSVKPFGTPTGIKNNEIEHEQTSSRLPCFFRVSDNETELWKPDREDMDVVEFRF